MKHGKDQHAFILSLADSDGLHWHTYRIISQMGPKGLTNATVITARVKNTKGFYGPVG